MLFDAFNLRPFTNLLISYFISHRFTIDHTKYSHFRKFHSSYILHLHCPALGTISLKQSKETDNIIH